MCINKFNYARPDKPRMARQWRRTRICYEAAAPSMDAGGVGAITNMGNHFCILIAGDKKNFPLSLIYLTQANFRKTRTYVPKKN